MTTVGTWNSGSVSAAEPPHFVSSEVGAYKRFQPNLPSAGLVRIRVRYPVKNASARSTVVPFSVVVPAGTTNITNQNGSQATPGQGGDWVVLGEFQKRAGYPSPDYLDVKLTDWVAPR